MTGPVGHRDSTESRCEQFSKFIVGSGVASHEKL